MLNEGEVIEVLDQENPELWLVRKQEDRRKVRRHSRVKSLCNIRCMASPQLQAPTILGHKPIPRRIVTKLGEVQYERCFKFQQGFSSTSVPGFTVLFSCTFAVIQILDIIGSLHFISWAISMKLSCYCFFHARLQMCQISLKNIQK
jgi:hypothetical protein